MTWSFLGSTAFASHYVIPVSQCCDTANCSALLTHIFIIEMLSPLLPGKNGYESLKLLRKWRKRRKKFFTEAGETTQKLINARNPNMESNVTSIEDCWAFSIETYRKSWLQEISHRKDKTIYCKSRCYFNFVSRWPKFFYLFGLRFYLIKVNNKSSNKSIWEDLVVKQQLKKGPNVIVLHPRT